ncbi:hypothetical protein [Streptomyces sp. NPDC056821]|uniref:hypothetical protein n=1 Tax=Streptomyces sp. NPDC056821 TaxID=3345952 RepID=UPI0036BDC33D
MDTPRREPGAVYYLSEAEPRADKPTTPRTSPHPDHAADQRLREVVNGANVA